MKKLTLSYAIAALVWLLPLIYLLWVYSAMPQTVPMHYGADGMVDRYGPKTEFAVTICIVQGIAVGVYLLLMFLPAIDPKQKVKYSEGTFQKIALGIVTFMAALCIAIIFATVNRQFKIEQLLLPLIGLFFAFMGNIMYSIKPNYFAGVRTPWTLESEDNWRATHQLAGKIWFAGGLAITALMLVFHGVVAVTIFIVAILLMAFTPVIYSYIYFRKHRQKQ